MHSNFSHDLGPHSPHTYPLDVETLSLVDLPPISILSWTTGFQSSSLPESESGGWKDLGCPPAPRQLGDSIISKP